MNISPEIDWIVASDCSIEIGLCEKPKQRQPVWNVSVSAREQLLFSDMWIGFVLTTRESALWLGGCIVNAIDMGVYVFPSGHVPSEDSSLHTVSRHVNDVVDWSTERVDDLSANWGNYLLHVELMNGQLNGGVWWCSVAHESSHQRWNSSELRIWFKNANSAKWLVECLARCCEYDSEFMP